VFAVGIEEEQGFAAIVSNPPFQGGQKITGTLGTDYRDYLVEYLANSKRGSADLCSYFFLRASQLMRQNGQYGLLATNTIAQGDTREVGLDQLVAEGWTILRAISSRKWPGVANLEVAHMWLRHGNWYGLQYLDEMQVKGITPHLTPLGKIRGKPYPLRSNAGKSFIGSYVLGTGFLLKPEEAQSLIEKDERNQDILFPYLNGEDLNSRPDQSPSRWVINFHDWPLARAATYSDCISILKEKVKPERDLNKIKFRRERWWQFATRAPNLYTAITGLKRVLVRGEVSSHLTFCWQSTAAVFSHMLIVWSVEEDYFLTLLQSSIHGVWTLEYASTLGKGIRYTPTDCFETFPFPDNMQGLEAIGEQYNQHRQSIMLARWEGLTKTYNRFHDPHETAEDIVQLRELHKEMDEAVAHAYGWGDLELGHGFHVTKQGLRYTISEEARREVLGRLLKLNHERYTEEEAMGLHEKGAKGKNGRVKGNSAGKGLIREVQGELLFE
jgi:hypothetical protein